jgi:hypothetical protein
MRLLPGYHIIYPGDSALGTYVPLFVIPVVAGLLVGSLLWRVWSGKQGQSQNV